MADRKLDPQMEQALRLHDALGKVLEALAPLTPRARERVLAFAADKIEEEEELKLRGLTAENYMDILTGGAQPPKRKVSRQSRERISKAVKASWAKRKGKR